MSINPLYFILIVNIVSLIFLPWYTSRFNHKNSLNILKEKWIDNLRTHCSKLVEKCEKHYQSKQNYLEIKRGKANEDLSLLTQKVTEAMSEITGCRQQIRFLFRQDDSDYDQIARLIQELVDSVDQITNPEGILQLDSQRWDKSRKSFSEGVNVLLKKKWDEIA